MCTLFQRAACRLLVVYVGQAVPVYGQAKKHGLQYPEACSCGEIGNYGIQLKANRTALIQSLYNFEIKITSSFKRNEAWFQASVLYKFCLCTE